MKGYQYQVAVDYQQDKDGNLKNETRQFHVVNHDDIFKIIRLMEQREGFTPEMAEQFVIGLKLFTEVMMENPKKPLFRELKQHVGEMMKLIKQK